MFFSNIVQAISHLSPQDWIQILSGFAQASATAGVAFVLMRQARKFKRVEVYGQVITAFNAMNSVAVSDPRNLRTFDSIGRSYAADESEDQIRRRWCAFMWLEALQHIFLASGRKLLDEGYAKRSLEQQLNIILKDDLVFWIVRNRGFDPKFVRYCEVFRKDLCPSKPVDFSEEEALGSSNLRAPHRECLKSNKQNQSKAQPRKRRPRR